MRLKDIDAQIAELQALAEAAERACSYTASVQARKQIQALRKVRSEVQLAGKVRRAKTTIDALRLQQEAALLTGSHQAAQRLANEIRAHEVHEAEQQRIREETELSSLREAEVMAILLDAVRQLTPLQRMQLREVLDDADAPTMGAA